MKKAIVCSSLPVLALMAAGCVTPPAYYPSTTTAIPASTPEPSPIESPAKIRYVQVKDDQFEKSITFQGIAEEQTLSSSNSIPDIWFIRSWLNKDTGDVRHQIYWANTYRGTGWRFWQTASDESANSLQVVDIDKNVGYCSAYGGCSHSETVGIMVPDVLLRAKKGTGLQVKVKSKSGAEQILYLSSEQITAQLEGIAETAPKSTTQAATRVTSPSQKKKRVH